MEKKTASFVPVVRRCVLLLCFLLPIHEAFAQYGRSPNRAASVSDVPYLYNGQQFVFKTRTAAVPINADLFETLGFSKVTLFR
jgi:hypothetical protein